MNLRLKYHITVEFTYRVTLPVFQPIELNFMIQKTYIFKIVVVKINSFKVKEYNSKNQSAYHQIDLDVCSLKYPIIIYHVKM